MIGFEAVGFGLAFALGRLVYGLWLRHSAGGVEGDLPLVLTVGLSLVVGGVEGASLGTGQWLVLRRRFPELRWSAWALATALGGGLAWTLGMTIGNSLSAPPPVAVQILLLPVLALSFGGLLGACQWTVLRGISGVERGGLWIAANAVGWALGLVAAFVAVALVQEGTPWSVMVVIAVLAGAAMAWVPAELTGRTLSRIGRGAAMTQVAAEFRA